MHSAAWLSRSLVGLGRAEGEELLPAGFCQGAHPGGNYLHHQREVRHDFIYTLFQLLQAPRYRGRKHPEMQVF